MSNETTPDLGHLVDGPRRVPRDLALGLLARAEQAEAAVARVKAVHPRESTGFHEVCGTCFDERENQFTWPCPTVEALDRSDLPAVREFAAEHDPRPTDRPPLEES